MPQNQITIAYTPDSDDAFYYDAIESGEVQFPSGKPHFRREHMATLNRAALAGRFEVTAISSVVYPLIADRYAILSVGTSVGRGYGPVVASREPYTLADLAGCRVGVPGVPTTGWFLLRLLCPRAIPIEMPFDEIADAVADGHLAAGVMIHEELLYYPQVGLLRTADLGAEWCARNELPLPVGLNVIRRDLGMCRMRQICAAIYESLEYGLNNPEAALTRVRRYGRGEFGGCTEQFVGMFANADSLDMPADVQSALHVLFTQLVGLGLAQSVPPIDVVLPARIPAALA